jgi:hypothetical protein
MEIDYSAARFWFDILYWIGLLVVAGYTYLSNKAKANKAAIDRVDTRLHEEIRRIDVLEQRQAQAPTHDDIGKVYDKLNSINQTLYQMTGEFSGLRRSMELVNDYLLNGGGRK